MSVPGLSQETSSFGQISARVPRCREPARSADLLERPLTNAARDCVGARLKPLAWFADFSCQFFCVSVEAELIPTVKIRAA